MLLFLPVSLFAVEYDAVRSRRPRGGVEILVRVDHDRPNVTEIVYQVYRGLYIGAVLIMLGIGIV